MDDNKALSILSALANGVNPNSGEVFPADSPYQSPEIVRALFAAVRVLESSGGPSPSSPSKHSARSRPSSPSNSGKPWSREEDARLIDGFESGLSPRDLASKHERTLTGVEARLEKHGLLQPQHRVTTNRFVTTENADREPESRRVAR